MASSTSHSVLREAALASGLLSQQQLDDALNGLTTGDSGQIIAAEQISDEVVGERLAELG